MGKGSVQPKAVETEGRLALDLAAVLLHTEVGACWSVRWENRILVGTTVFVELLRGGACASAQGWGEPHLCGRHGLMQALVLLCTLHNPIRPPSAKGGGWRVFLCMSVTKL